MKITIRNLQKKIPITPKRIKGIILKILSGYPKVKAGEITICFVNDKQIKKINAKYLNKNTATDVIAFDLSEAKGSILADIAISADTAYKNAVVYKTRPKDELELYVIHGILHILGYDDNNSKNRALMRRKEQYFLARI